MRDNLYLDSPNVAHLPLQQIVCMANDTVPGLRHDSTGTFQPMAAATYGGYRKSLLPQRDDSWHDAIHDALHRYDCLLRDTPAAISYPYPSYTVHLESTTTYKLEAFHFSIYPSPSPHLFFSPYNPSFIAHIVDPYLYISYPASSLYIIFPATDSSPHNDMAPPPAWLRALVHEQDVEPGAIVPVIRSGTTKSARQKSSNSIKTTRDLPPYNDDLKCKQCGKLFRRVCNYREHQRVHSKEYKFRCTIPGCSGKFLWRSSIQAHLRSHQAKLQNRRRAAYATRSYPPIAAGVAKYANINKPPLSPISTLPQPSQLRPRS